MSQNFMKEVKQMKQTLKRVKNMLSVMAVLMVASRACGAELPKPAVPVEPGQIPADFVIPEYRPIPVAGQGNAAITLDGLWRANPKSPADVAASALDAPGWRDFQVPGHWETQGMPLEGAGVAAVGCDFSVPAAMAGKRLFLRFDAMVGKTEYWFNGVRLGVSEYYWSPVEFEVTGIAKPGQMNRLRLTQTVNHFGFAIQFTHYAGLRPHWPLATGIVRSVRLFALPPLHVSSLHVNTELDKDYRDADLILDLNVDHREAGPVEGASLKLALVDPVGQAVNLPKSVFPLDPLKPGATGVRLANRVVAPQKWNAEKPRLYRLTIELVARGQTLERIERNVGFRKIETRGQKILVNGVQVKLAGANHHEVDPVSHQAGTGRRGEQDVLALKNMNCNFVRTSHYPPTAELLDAADRHGLYVEVECPFHWTRNPVCGENDPARVRDYLMPTAAAVEYHRNHPSVVIWSLGNESGSKRPAGQGPGDPLPANYRATHALIKRMDPTRLTIFENEWNNDGGQPDLGCRHYPLPAIRQDDARPVLCGEIFYLLGYHNMGWGEHVYFDPGMRELWGMMGYVNWSPPGGNRPDNGWNQVYQSENLGGMCFWEMLGVGGLVDIWRRPKPEGWIATRMYAQLHIPVRQVAFKEGQKSVQIPVENRYSFTDLSELKVTWEFADRGGTIDPARPAPGAKPIALGLPPRSQGNFEILLPEGTKEGQMLVIRAVDGRGRLVNAHGIALGNRPASPLPAPVAGCPEFKDDGKTLEIRGKQFGFRIDKATGEVFPLAGAARPALKSLPAVYVAAGSTAGPLTVLPELAGRKVESVTATREGKSLLVQVKDRYADFAGGMELRVDAAGIAECAYDYVCQNKLTVAEAGLRLQCEPACEQLSWRRAAEWDVYPADQIGRPEGTASARRGGAWAGKAVSTWTDDCHWTIFSQGWKPIAAAPTWPWGLDESEAGTSDFRSTKYNIYEATLADPAGRGVRVRANGDANVRAAMDSNGAILHLWRLPGPPKARPTQVEQHYPAGSRLQGRFTMELAATGIAAPAQQRLNTKGSNE
jgi:hypothetical protein